MFSVKQDMLIRLREAADLIRLIEAVENGNITSASPINAPVLRSSAVLTLYNVIESTTTRILIKIHEEINASKSNYNNLIKEIKDLALVYFYKHKAKNADIHTSLDVLHHTVDLLRGRGVFKIKYNEMEKSYQLFSGNLDAKAIRNVMKKYGITISENHGEKLHQIKKGRNTLAHGNQSFEDFGRNLVVRVLKDYLTDVTNFLTEVIDESSKYIDKKQYRQQKKKIKPNSR